MAKRPACKLLVERGLAADEKAARAAVMAGRVHSGSERVEKPGDLLAEDAPLSVRASKRFVSRGGEKLDHGLNAFGVEVKGRVALDAGASTGGFTDCMLQHGAAKVYAVDVGYGQLAWELREDERVAVMERTNVRRLAPGELNPAPDLLAADISFSSIATLLPQLASLGAPGFEMVVLVKPQFEVGRGDTDAGVVRDEGARRRALAGVADAARAAGLEVLGSVESPIRGAAGNIEYLLHLRAAPR